MLSSRAFSVSFSKILLGGIIVSGGLNLDSLLISCVNYANLNNTSFRALINFAISDF